MTPFNALLYGLILVTQLTPINMSQAASAPKPAAAEQPKLTLEGANGENHCTLDFKDGTYVFKGNKHCQNDKAVGLELEHVPSASNIVLYDDYTCDRNDSGNYFWVYLRTVKEDLTTDGPIDLDKIASTPNGQVVAPGLVVMDKYQKPGQTMKKRTSCVRIEVDAPPLPPALHQQP
jgi:hypothetical protein